MLAKRSLISVVQLHTFYNDIPLGPATGFFYKVLAGANWNCLLIMNWHVLTGRNSEDLRVLHTKGSIPNRLHVSLLLQPNQPEHNGRENEILIQDQMINLYNAEGKALWFQHRTRNAVDAAVINVGMMPLDRYYFCGINEVANQNDIAIQIGNEVFILGYPLGFAHFMKTPIWKRGSIASEPNLETAETRSRVVIDATTRQGMSGGPVIMRAKTHYVTDEGQVKEHVNATRWIGIYASRPDLPSVASGTEEDRRAEVGFFYKSGNVVEVITQGIPGPDFGLAS